MIRKSRRKARGLGAVPGWTQLDTGLRVEADLPVWGEARTSKKVGDIEYVLFAPPRNPRNRIQDEFVTIRATRDDGRYMGTLTATKHVDAPFLEVTGAYSKGSRGSRVGTRMYEMMAAFACADGRTLTSDTARTEDSEGFWNKQFRKERAIHECVTRLKMPDGTFLSEWRQCAPMSSDGRLNSFTRYRLKSCPAPSNLEGLRRTRRKRR